MKNNQPRDGVRPWHLLNPAQARVSPEVRDARLSLCRECEYFRSTTRRCDKCGCVMPFKVVLADAGCPIGKWNPVVDSHKPDLKVEL